MGGRLHSGMMGDLPRNHQWITLNDRKLSLCRAFRLVRHRDNTVLAQAITSYTCVSFATSRVKRMPDLFIEQYKVTI
jgi:acyl-CoA thioesterase FadM